MPDDAGLLPAECRFAPGMPPRLPDAALSTEAANC